MEKGRQKKFTSSLAETQRRSQFHMTRAEGKPAVESSSSLSNRGEKANQSQTSDLNPQEGEEVSTLVPERKEDGGEERMDRKRERKGEEGEEES